MNRVVRYLLIALAVLVLAAPLAQAEGWSLGKLNPFGKSSSTSKSKKKSSWAKPSFKLPRWKTPAPIKKVNQSTTRMASKTWDTLTFWDNDKKPAKRWESGASYTNAKSEKKGNWLTNLFTVEDKKPGTPGEFLRQPRPE